MHEKKLEIIKLNCEVKSLTQQNYSLQAELNFKNENHVISEEKTKYEKLYQQKMSELEEREIFLKRLEEDKYLQTKNQTETLKKNLETQRLLEEDKERFRRDN